MRSSSLSEHARPLFTGSTCRRQSNRTSIWCSILQWPRWYGSSIATTLIRQAGVGCTYYWLFASITLSSTSKFRYYTLINSKFQGTLLPLFDPLMAIPFRQDRTERNASNRERYFLCWAWLAYTGAYEINLETL